MSAIFLIAGAALVVTGVAFVYWPAALIVAGLLLLVGGADLARDVQREVTE